MLIIGCGNRDRGDDGAGVLVADQLKALGIRARIQGGDVLQLLELWNGFEEVILIDAVTTGAPAGTVHDWNAAELRLADSPSASTHGLGLAQTIELGRSLGGLPRQLHLYGIEGRRFGIGEQMSAEVRSAVQKVVWQIAGEAARKAANTALPKEGAS